MHGSAPAAAAPALTAPPAAAAAAAYSVCRTCRNPAVAAAPLRDYSPSPSPRRAAAPSSTRGPRRGLRGLAKRVVMYGRMPSLSLSADHKNVRGSGRRRPFLRYNCVAAAGMSDCIVSVSDYMTLKLVPLQALFDVQVEGIVA